MKYDCLIIDDEEMLAKNTCEYFNMFEVHTTFVISKEEVTNFFSNNQASIVLLDINLKDSSGFEICKLLREKYDMPILFISARNTDDDKMIALNIGGDDYIEKPYSLGVLLAKVKVILKRYNKTQDSQNYDDNYLKIDKLDKQVYVKNELVKLTPIEFKLLNYLVDNKNRLITKEELFDNVWEDTYSTDNTLNVHIRKIREAIEIDPKKPNYIITVYKEGYKFVG
jgi:two-component system response regulator RegX3